MAAGASAWAVVAIGRSFGIGAVATAVCLAVLTVGRFRRAAATVLAVVVAAGAISGWMGTAREDATLQAAVPEGPQTVVGRLLVDPAPNQGGERFTLAPSHLRQGDGFTVWAGPRLVVYSTQPVAAVAGERVMVIGRVRAVPGRVRGDPVAGRVTARAVESLGAAADPLFRTGNWVRGRVAHGLDSYRGDPAAALISGFLIGDVRQLPTAEATALRRAGLTHFVAVSGSNVALFLGAWFLVAGPLGVGARRRATVGLVGLALFVVITRWEPSVVRAASMAALVLVGRVANVPIDAWTALGGAVTAVLLVSPDLAVDAGFQLSVAATAGVLVGARLFAGRRPRWAWTTLGATLSAQAAVAPVLLWYFGSVPLMAPMSNLLAGPVVVGATAAGGVGVLTGLAPVTGLGVAMAKVVLLIADLASAWPQLGWVGVAVAVAVVGIARIKRLRPFLALAVAAWVSLSMAWPVSPPSVPTAVFIDVGQGDSALLRGPSGSVILIDGGPDPQRLAAALRRYGVRRIDLMIVSHHHADHVTGLIDVVDSMPVGAVWHPNHPGERELFEELLHRARRRGIPVEVPSPGWSASIGEFTIDVLAPLRRYVSPNDQSLVVEIEAAGTTVLFAGDIETFAQRELGPLRADVLKVPHQGAATSDLEWLRRSAPSLAVISVGANNFGHPSQGVIDVLEDAGAVVWRTDTIGDIRIEFGRGLAQLIQSP